MSKRLNIMNGNDFIRMVEKGAQQLREHVDHVNALNVFPVPDGDTGTNMNLTLTSGVEELRRRPSGHLGQAAETLARGLLMGARGNSGVYLSMLLRGFAQAVKDQASIHTGQFAAALQAGVDLTYASVEKPIEGTILTVSKEAAKHAVLHAKQTNDFVELMKEVCRQGQEALSRTPEQLPILKQVGVVDAGGQGLLYIYIGFLQALQEEEDVRTLEPGMGAPVQPTHPHSSAEVSRAQAKLATEDIEFGYCTEFMVRRNGSKAFNEVLFRQELSQFGDSLLVIADDDLVKVHIHAEFPGNVMNHAMHYGDLIRIKIENMREQHMHLLHDEEAEPAGHEASEPGNDVKMLKPYGFVSVSAGEGLSKIMTSLGVDQVLYGGQTMNPSTEDIVRAVELVQARTVFILPNNANIISAAQQAVDLISGKQLIVIPTKSVPQGIAAVVASQVDATVESNTERMLQAMEQVQSGQVTYAVRDTQLDGVNIKQRDFIAILNGKIVAAAPDVCNATRQLVDQLIGDATEIVTLYTGENAVEEHTHQLVQYIQETYADVDVEVHSGGQPVYSYIISAE